MARVALVTGGSRGIGAAISKGAEGGGLQGRGELCRQRRGGREVQGETGIPFYKWSTSRRLRCLRAGIARSRPISARRRAGQQRRHHRDAMFHKMTPQQWNEVIDTNLNSLFNMTHPVWRACATASSAASSTSPRSTARRARWAR
jgi:acetoacetyl-CoA reductase